MSTLMSTDMNISRSSTRVRASPGGATTISFGDENETKTKPPMPPAAPIAAVVEKSADPSTEDEIFMTIKKMETLSVSSSSKSVGIALATAAGAEEITVAIAKALASKGITNVAVTLVASPSVLPYLVKQMTENCDVIVAIGTLLPDEQFMAEVLIESLIQTGLTAKTPVVPAIISPTGILELKSSLAHLCDGWSNSVSSLLALGVTEPTLVSSLMIAAPEAVAASEPVADASLPKPPAVVNRRAQGGAATLTLG